MKKQLILSLIAAPLINAYSITLEETLNIAEKNATKIRLSDKDIEKVEAQIKEAKSNNATSIHYRLIHTMGPKLYNRIYTEKPILSKSRTNSKNI
jgi:hypothetical protein